MEQKIYAYKLLDQPWVDLQWGGGAIYEHAIERAQRDGWEVIETKMVEGRPGSGNSMTVHFLVRKEIK